MGMRYEVVVDGKVRREYEFEDVSKARAYVRKKAKEGFDAVRCHVYDDLVSVRLRGDGSGCCAFEYDGFGTPGYQAFVEYALFRDNGGAVIQYHSRAHRCRNGLKDVEGFQAGLDAVRVALDALRLQAETCPDVSYYIRDAIKGLEAYLRGVSY